MHENADPDNYSCSRYGIWSDARGYFSIPDESRLGKNVLIFGIGNSSSVHCDTSEFLLKIQQVG